MLKYAVVGLALVLVTLAIWPHRLIASPNFRFRLVDDSGQALEGVRVIREWRTSEGQEGKSETATDINGVVTFSEEVVHISILKFVTKPLFRFFPAMCGPGWEIYGTSEFRAYSPSGYILRSSPNQLDADRGTPRNKSGLEIRDFRSKENPNESYIASYCLNRQQDLDCTLTFYREKK